MLDRESARKREEEAIDRDKRYTLKQARALAEKSQKQVANAVGVTQQTYLKWERGDTVPNVIKARLLAIELGVDLAQLIF